MEAFMSPPPLRSAFNWVTIVLLISVAAFFLAAWIVREARLERDEFITTRQPDATLLQILSSRKDAA